MQSNLPQAVEFVRLGYGDVLHLHFFCAYSFRTGELSTTEAQQVLQVVPQYNAFIGQRIANALERFKGRVASYEFGRESSPVLYIRLPATTNHVEGQVSATVGPRVPEADLAAVRSEMEAAFMTELQASEFSVDEKYKKYIRVWWD